MQISMDLQGREKEEKLEETIDELKDKFGKDLIKRGNVL